MSTHSSTTDRPIRLARKNTQGIIAGLDMWNLITLAAAAGIAIVSINRWGFPAFFVSMPIWLTLAIAGLAQYHGVAFPRIAAQWVSLHVRRVLGGTTTRFRPERPQIAGTLNLPGRLASIQVWDADGQAVAYNPFSKTISITAELEVQGFLMLEMPERNELARNWGQVLAGFTQRDGITRVSLQERTVPTTILPARQFYAETVTRRGLDPESAVARNYGEVLNQSESFAVSHKNYVTLTFDLIKLQGQIKNLGGGKAGILALARIETANVTDALRSARFDVRKWLSVREWAALGRTAFDPEYLSATQSRLQDDAGVDLAAIGPMALDEPAGKNGIVRSDSGWHSTMWIHEWPRTETHVGFIEPLVFARHPNSGEAVTHIFSLVLTPVKTRSALKRIDDEKRTWRTNQRVKAKRNQQDSAADNADWDALIDQEQSIVAGEGEYRYGAYLTVSATSEEKLNSSLAGMRNALTRAGMEPQILYCQQAEALMVNALPLGQGMK